MNSAGKHHVSLVLDWENPGGTTALRRNTTGFAQIKELAENADTENPLKLNAFLYSFLCSAKNLDLFLQENTTEITNDVEQIATKMTALEELERNGVTPNDPLLLQTYIEVRNVAARRCARDEQRSLATLLFSGPSTGLQVAEDLGISENLAIRTLRTLSPVVEQSKVDTDLFCLRSDANSLAITLYLLRYTLGIDPIRVLQARIALDQKEV